MAGKRKRPNATASRVSDDEDQAQGSTVPVVSRHVDLAVRRGRKRKTRITQTTAHFVEHITAEPSIEPPPLIEPDNILPPDTQEDPHAELPIETPWRRKRRRRRRGGKGVRKTRPPVRPLLTSGSQGNAKPLRDWIPFRDTFLDEMVRLEGLGEHDRVPLCEACVVRKELPAREGIFRCADCTQGLRICQGCMLVQHEAMHLHRIQVSAAP